MIKKIIKFFNYQYFYKFYLKKIAANSIYNKKDGITYRKYKFNEYNSYLEHQSFKFFLYKQPLLNTFNEAVSNFFNNFKKIKLKKNSYILCLGARTGAEVKAFRKLGFFSIGIDLAFPKNSPFVLYGDFHNLDFPGKSFDLIYSNTLELENSPRRRSARNKKETDKIVSTVSNETTGKTLIMKYDGLIRAKSNFIKRTCDEFERKILA
jgi:hypothetical protein